MFDVDGTQNIERREEEEILSEEFLATCAEEEDAVLSAIRSGMEGISESCNALLNDHADVQCFELESIYGADSEDDQEEDTVPERTRIQIHPRRLNRYLGLAGFVLISVVSAAEVRRRRRSPERQEIETRDTGEVVLV